MLGQGGMGVVYLCRARNGSQVAVKVIRNRLLGDPAALRRFQREVQLARMVPRHCTAPVIDADLEHDPPYLVTEYVKGPTLEAAVADDPLTPSMLHGVAIAIADALTEIHRVGVVHGDLTPRNVLLSPSGPRVIDFGIARVPTQATGSSANQIIGTPAFMAPEQFDPSASLTPAGDVFAWGSVMAFAGTGRKPFGDGAPIVVGRQIVEQPPDLDGLDPILREIVEAALEKDPAGRPSAATLRERLTTAARVADHSEDRAMVVHDVLRTAREHSEPPLFTPAHRWPEESHPRGFPIVLTAIVSLGLLLFAAGVWFHQPGRLGPLVSNLAQWLFGYGVYVVPIVAAAWIYAMLYRRRTPPLWLLAKAVARDPSRGVILRALWSTAAAIARSIQAGPLSVLLCGLALLHVLRGTAPPPLDAASELQQSGGLIGALLADPLVFLVKRPTAIALLVLWLLYGIVTTTNHVDRRWGRRTAVATVVACLIVAVVPALYFKDHRYKYWAKFDSTDHVAVYQGLSSHRRRPVRVTSLTREMVPKALQGSVNHGIQAEDGQDALSLVSRVLMTSRQLRFAPSYDDEGRQLVAGTCLGGAEPGSPIIACRKRHGFEVAATLGTPYRVFPGRQALAEFAGMACRTAFQSFVGIPWEASMGDYKTLQPDGQAWRAGSEAVACIVQPGLVSEMTGSLHETRHILEDDFSDESHWRTDENNNCSIEYGDAELLIDKKKDATFCVSTLNEESADPSFVENAAVGVDVTAGAKAPGDGRVGLVCRWVNDRNLYALSADVDGSYRIARVQHGHWTRLKTGEGAKIQSGRRLRLRASCSDGKEPTSVKLALWAGNKLLGSVTDTRSPLRKGTVGVIVEASGASAFQASFDNLAAAAPRGP
jgi:predicted Ser/Thr protein kinase